MIKFSLVTHLIFFYSITIYAQLPKGLKYRDHPKLVATNNDYYTIGAFFCGLNYFGDLAPTNQVGSTYIPLTRAGFGVTGSYRLKGSLWVRAGFMWGRLRGDDFTAEKEDRDGRFRYTRNLHFRNDIKELSVEVVLSLFNAHRTFLTRRKVSPYLFLGVAVFHHNPKAMVPHMDALHYDVFEAQPIVPNDPRYAGVSPGDWIALKPLGTEGQNQPGSEIKPYSNWQFAIPAGVGLRFRISRFFDMAFEIGVRQTFTDYLDDVSGYFLNPDSFGKGGKANLSRLMADRSKEPVTAVSGLKRDLKYILHNVHPTVPYGELPEEFGSLPYEMIEGYGMEGPGNNRGKEAYDIFVVTKLAVRFYLGRGIGYRKIVRP